MRHDTDGLVPVSFKRVKPGVKWSKTIAATALSGNATDKQRRYISFEPFPR
jgi:hypothetical protein